MENHRGDRKEIGLMITKIVSGGQTGADRAGLDWAIAHGIPHGGWCPKDRLSEDGAIAACYDLQETEAVDLSRTDPPKCPRFRRHRHFYNDQQAFAGVAADTSHGRKTWETLLTFGSK